MLVDSSSKIIVKPILWNWYFIFSSSLGFLSGILSSFTRLVIYFIYAIISIFRVESTILPKYWSRFDVAYISFMSYISTLHQHENPICHTAIDLWQAQNSQKSQRSNRARNRWHLAYSLLIDPDLKKYRKNDTRGSHLGQQTSIEMV